MKASRIRRGGRLVLASLLGVIYLSGASAAVVTQFGDNVSFTYDDSTLFGTGTVIGDNIVFLPTNFSLESTDGTTVPTLVEVLNITILSLDSANFGFDSIEVTEFGDYILDDGVNGNDPSVGGASVSASLRTQVMSLNPAWIGATSVDIDQTGVITAPQDGTTNDWMLNSVNQWGWGTDTGVIFQIQNTLVADTDALDERAFIQKKVAPISIEVQAIPIPAAGLLFMASMFALGSARLIRK